MMAETKDVVASSQLSNTSDDNHAHFIMQNIAVGMNVRCRQSNELSTSDIGTVVEIKVVNGLHDFNVKVYLNKYIQV